jgi:hypothetical protein
MAIDDTVREHLLLQFGPPGPLPLRPLSTTHRFLSQPDSFDDSRRTNCDRDRRDFQGDRSQWRQGARLRTPVPGCTGKQRGERTRGRDGRDGGEDAEQGEVEHGDGKETVQCGLAHTDVSSTGFERKSHQAEHERSWIRCCWCRRTG